MTRCVKWCMLYTENSNRRFSRQRYNGGENMGFFSTCYENVVYSKTQHGECEHYGKADPQDPAGSCRYYHEIKSKNDIVYKD